MEASLMRTPITILLGAFLLLSACAAYPALGEEKQPHYKRGTPVSSYEGDIHALADIPEAEPNDSSSQAQDLGCGNSLRPASLTNAGAVADTDWISFTANAGDLITFDTATADLPVTDTVINLFANDGLTSLAVDDDATPGSLYSRVADFQAPYSGVYYGRIRGFSAAEGAYQANLSCVAPPSPPANDRCDGAILLPYGTINLSGTTRFATDDYDLCPGIPVCPASCTHFNSPGKDVVYRLDVARA